MITDKPDGHPDELVDWERVVQSPGRMTNSEFKEIAIADPSKFPIAPHKPTKTDYFKVLINNMLLKANVEDPESYFDEQRFSAKVKKDLGRRNKTGKHHEPVPPPRPVVIASSTPNSSEVVLTPPPPEAERTILGTLEPTPRQA